MEVDAPGSAMERVQVGASESSRGVHNTSENVIDLTSESDEIHCKRRRLNIAAPWDKDYKELPRDIFTGIDQLNREVEVAKVQHWGPNCATFSGALRIPIPGAANPPRLLRSEEWPGGDPELLQYESPTKRRRIQVDTDMADMAATRCGESVDRGGLVSLEHPANSLAHFDPLPTSEQLHENSSHHALAHSFQLHDPLHRGDHQ